MVVWKGVCIDCPDDRWNCCCCGFLSDFSWVEVSKTLNQLPPCPPTTLPPPQLDLGGFCPAFRLGIDQSIQSWQGRDIERGMDRLVMVMSKPHFLQCLSNSWWSPKSQKCERLISFNYVFDLTPQIQMFPNFTFHWRCKLCTWLQFMEDVSMMSFGTFMYGLCTLRAL